MTRFARAQGSKASNERIPEEATSWAEMKNQIQSSSSNTTEQSISPEKLKSLKAKSKKKEENEWASFDDVPKPKMKKKKVKQSDEVLHSVKSGKIKKPKKSTEGDDSPSGKTEVQKKLLFLAQAEVKPVAEVRKEVVKSTPKQQEQAKKKKPGRNKPLDTVMVVDGREIQIELYDRFPVTKEDAERLRELKKTMINEGIPKDQITRAMKLERRRAEKALSRERKKLCFHCRGSGHLMSDCPKLSEGSCSICFKCGSTEHKSSQCQVTRSNDYRYGQCFVCGEQGHISRQCPDNPRGLYPQGGSCRLCGDVTHLRKDCPQAGGETAEQAVATLSTTKNLPLEGLGDEKIAKPQEPVRKNKIIKF
ncbi:hypothetical protein B566_EDAN004903 [Ephemera danica]|nr:hypothetical protein B566_EDAN004903 [Ephemera danica]